MQKAWKDIFGYEGLYQVSNTGHVRRIAPGHHTQVGKILKQSLRGQRDYKYLCVCLYKDGEKKVRQVHKMVIESFTRPLRDGEVTRHLDGNRFNNNIWNLAHGTQKENISDRCHHGNTVKGAKHWKAKMDNTKVRKIRLLYVSGSHTQKQLASKFDVSQSAISSIVLRLTWKHVK